MKDDSKVLEIKTKRHDWYEKNGRIVYVARTTIWMDKVEDSVTTFAEADTWQKAGELSLSNALTLAGLSLDDLDIPVDFLV